MTQTVGDRSRTSPPKQHGAAPKIFTINGLRRDAFAYFAIIEKEKEM